MGQVSFPYRVEVEAGETHQLLSLYSWLNINIGNHGTNWAVEFNDPLGKIVVKLAKKEDITIVSLKWA